MHKPDIIQDNLREDYPDYLRDESRRTGEAIAIAFPKTEGDVIDVMRWCAANDMNVTCQGARTGIVGGATADGGLLLNVSGMKRVLGMRPHPQGGKWLVTVEPGVLLSEIDAMLGGEQDINTTEWTEQAKRALAALQDLPTGACFAPDVTENGASLGGMVATNASGARSYAYGATRRHIHGVRMVLSDGDTVVLERGLQKADGRDFRIETEGGRLIEGALPGYRMPDVKNAAGYYVTDGMDLIDLVIGAEGTLGAVTAVELVALPCPAAIWGITAFLPGESEALRFVRQCREQTRAAAIEFMDHRALDLLREEKRSNPAFKDLPDLANDWHTGIYVEYHGDEESVMEQVENLATLLEGCDGDPDATWMASTHREIEQFKEFRHAIPEAVNLMIDERRRSVPDLTKLGTDLAVPDDALEWVMALYRQGLTDSALEAVSFGHIGNNHVHVNIIPRDVAEYARGKELYLDWARQVVERGGSVSAEHGIGKLKTQMLAVMFGHAGIAEMYALKRLFDPSERLGRGTLFGRRK